MHVLQWIEIIIRWDYRKAIYNLQFINIKALVTSLIITI